MEIYKLFFLFFIKNKYNYINFNTFHAKLIKMNDFLFQKKTLNFLSQNI